MGPGTLAKLLSKASNFTQAATAARKAGVREIGGRSYELLAKALTRDLGRESAVSVAAELFSRGLDPKTLAALDEAASAGRWPRRTAPPARLNDLFKSNGEPTRMGAGVLEWARRSRVAARPPASSPPASPTPTSVRLPANREALLPFLEIQGATTKRISPLLPHAPEYGATEYTRLVENTIGAIHQIPRLYRKLTGRRVELKQIEAYFGRSSGGVGNLKQRWIAAQKRGHTYGLVFARCSVVSSLSYERHGILLLDVLRKYDGLCISNNSMKAVGRVGSSEPGLLYMTFRILDQLDESPARELSRSQIEEIVRKTGGELRALSRSTAEMDAMSSAISVGLDLANDTKVLGRHKLAHFSESDGLRVFEPGA